MVNHESQGALDVDRHLETVRAAVAIVGSQRGAVVDDPADADLSGAIIEAFAVAEVPQTYTQIAAAVGRTPDDPQLRRRFDLLRDERAIVPRHGKKHQSRYTLDPAAYSGKLVFDRLRSDHGVSELIGLLDRALRLTEDERATEDDVATSLRAMRGLMRLQTDSLHAAATHAPIHDLYAQQRAHGFATFRGDLDRLHRVVVDRFPNLRRHARALLEDAQAYTDAVKAVIDRVVAEGAAARTFMVLSPQEYRSAAATATRDELAAVARHLLFDPPAAHVDPGQVADACEQAAQAPTGSRRRPQPPPEQDVTDPIERARDRARKQRERLIRVAESLLDEADEVELTRHLARDWQATAKLVAQLLQIKRDPTLPYEVDFVDAVLTSAGGPVTYLTPAHLRRVPTTPSAAGRDQTEVIARG